MTLSPSLVANGCQLHWSELVAPQWPQCSVKLNAVFCMVRPTGADGPGGAVLSPSLICGQKIQLDRRCFQIQFHCTVRTAKLQNITEVFLNFRLGPTLCCKVARSQSSGQKHFVYMLLLCCTHCKEKLVLSTREIPYSAGSPSLGTAQGSPCRCWSWSSASLQCPSGRW